MSSKKELFLKLTFFSRSNYLPGNRISRCVVNFVTSVRTVKVLFMPMMKSSIKSSSKNCQLSFYEDNDDDAGSSRAVCAWQRDWDRL